MALEESRSLILPPQVILNPYIRPTASQIAAIQSRSPLNPNNPNYLSLNGEIVNANGYPISSWRWLKVCREWWSILRPMLWRDLVVAGYAPWANLLALLDDGSFLLAVSSSSFDQALICSCTYRGLSLSSLCPNAHSA